MPKMASHYLRAHRLASMMGLPCHGPISAFCQDGNKTLTADPGQILSFNSGSQALQARDHSCKRSDHVAGEAGKAARRLQLGVRALYAWQDNRQHPLTLLSRSADPSAIQSRRSNHQRSRCSKPLGDTLNTIWATLGHSTKIKNRFVRRTLMIKYQQSPDANRCTNQPMEYLTK